jgi:hypothetical protein
MNPFGIAFTNPALWVGLFAIGVPVLVHLMTRRTPVEIVFPTLRFLKNAKANQSRIHRIRHKILLLLRTLLIALILATFLRPVYQQGTLAETAEGDSAVAAIVILDASLSMGYQGGRLTPFSQGKVAASEILERLGSNDVANLILAKAQPIAIFQEPRGGVGQLQSELEKAQPSLERADLDAAVALALEQLERSEGLRKEIHFVSDFQRTNWASVDFSAIPEAVQTVFVSVGPEEAENTAVMEVLLSPASPSISEEIEIVCRVANYSPRPHAIGVELSFDGASVSEKSVDIDPGMTASASFRVRPKRMGALEGTLRIPHDGLEADDVRYFVLPVTDRVRVGVSAGESGSGKPGELERILRAAIDPLGDEGGPLVPQTIPQEGLGNLAQQPIQVLLTAGTRPFDNEEAASVLNFLKGGGGVVFFLNGPADRVNLERLAEISEGEFEPAYRLGGMVDLTDDPRGNFATFHEAQYEHPILRKFRETGALADLHFFRYFKTDRAGTKGRILIRYEDGNIALAESSVGTGNILVANFSVDRGASDLSRSTTFVPLLHETIASVRPRGGAGRTFEVGGPCSTTVSAPQKGASFRFESPDEKEIDASLAQSGEEVGVMIGDTAAPGFYRIYEGADRIGSIAVNVDSRESNLERLSLEQVQDLSRISRNRFYASQGKDVAALRRLREGAPLWHYLLLAAVAALAMEQMLALLWKR